MRQRAAPICGMLHAIIMVRSCRLLEAPNAAAAIKMLQANKVTLAVVPPPAPNEKDVWWSLLAGDPKNILTVFASLPFENLKPGRSNARRRDAVGFCRRQVVS